MNEKITVYQIRNVSKQYQQLENRKDELHGLYVLPREEDVFTWDGILFVSHGMWEEGIFKFTLKIPIENYESTIPVLKFVTPLFHPFVNPRTQCLDIQYIFPQWRTDSHRLVTILVKVVQMFYETTFDINLCPNVDAAKFFHSNTNEIAKKEIRKAIRKCVDDSIKMRFDPIPGASLLFSKPSNMDIDGFNNVVKELDLQ